MNPLVAPLWLAERRSDPNIVVLDATLSPVGVTPPIDTRARYVEKHIPGALFFDIEEFSDHATFLPHMLPSKEEFSRKMSALGVSDAMTILVYEQEGVFSAPRAWWMLRTFGVKEVYILDGGLRAWIDIGFPVRSGHGHRPPANFHAALASDAVKNFAQIQRLIAGHGQILDARPAGRFDGTAPEPRAGVPSGHMPGSVSTPFTELVADGRMKSARELRDLFVSKGIDMEQPITTTCGSGITAAVIALGLEIAGAKNVSLYDGSWAEYAQRKEASIEKSS